MAFDLDDGRGEANRLMFRTLADRMYEGPQGQTLQDFVELHSTELAKCHLGIVSRKGAIVSSKASWVAKTETGTGKGRFIKEALPK